MSASTVPPLPLELHLHILRLAYPSRPEDDHQHRRRDLLWCSLVSEAWKELAEPLLWYSLTLRSNLLIDWLTKVPEHLRHFIRHVVFRGGKTASALFRTSRFRTAFRLLPELESVVVIGAFKLDSTKPLLLSDLECLSNLRSLSIGSALFLDPRASLPRLSTLHLSNVYFEHDLSGILTPSAFPALSQLSLGDIADPGLHHVQLEQLAQQLDILQVDLVVALVHDAIFQVPFRRVLLVVEEDDLEYGDLDPAFSPTSPHPPRYLLVNTSYPPNYCFLQPVFDLPQRPKALFLPSSPPCPPFPTSDYADVGPSPQTEAHHFSSLVSSERERGLFLERCEQAGIEVRYCRPVPEDHCKFGGTEFREYVDEQKGREEQRT
ncbi:hypothetical protein JCM8097_005746 [Rhodosporidiobolus ruineniae]